MQTLIDAKNSNSSNQHTSSSPIVTVIIKRLHVVTPCRAVKIFHYHFQVAKSHLSLISAASIDVDITCLDKAISTPIDALLTSERWEIPGRIGKMNFSRSLHMLPQACWISGRFWPYLSQKLSGIGFSDHPMAFFFLRYPATISEKISDHPAVISEGQVYNLIFLGVHCSVFFLICRTLPLCCYHTPTLQLVELYSPPKSPGLKSFSLTQDFC